MPVRAPSNEIAWIRTPSRGPSRTPSPTSSSSSGSSFRRRRSESEAALTAAEKRRRFLLWFILRRSLPASFLVMLVQMYLLHSHAVRRGGGGGSPVMFDALFGSYGYLQNEDAHAPRRGGMRRTKDDDGGRPIVDSMRPFVNKHRTPEQRMAAYVRRPRTLTAMFRCSPRRELSAAADDAPDVGANNSSAPIIRPSHRLIFIHVLRTGGSTLREFFADYARRCSASWAVLSGCISLDPESMLGYDDGGGTRKVTRKTGEHDGKCVVKRSLSRTGEAEKGNGTNVVGPQLAEQFDMFGGHLPLGTGNIWNDEVDEGGKPRILSKFTYFTFFRNAVTKYLSGISYVTKAVHPPQAISHINASVHQKLADGHYTSDFADYFITPQQRMVDRMEGREGPRSSEEQTLRVMMNLLKFHVVVGMTERMSDSLRVLEALMDEGGDATGVFDKYGREREGLLHANNRTANPSKLFTTELMKKLERDRPLLFADVLEYTKFEQQISDFALALHMKQMNISLTPKVTEESDEDDD